MVLGRGRAKGRAWYHLTSQEETMIKYQTGLLNFQFMADKNFVQKHYGSMKGTI